MLPSCICEPESESIFSLAECNVSRHIHLNQSNCGHKVVCFVESLSYDQVKWCMKGLNILLHLLIEAVIVFF